jgi:hypothetical protein
MQSKFPKSTYNLGFCSGLFMDEEGKPVSYAVENVILIDSDYKFDVVLGAYFPNMSRVYDKYKGEITCKMQSFNCDEDTDETVAFYSKTQSPVFNSAPFPKVSNFHSLYRSTVGANGYDVVMMNITQLQIHPIGNLVIDLKDSVDTKGSGMFVLRSRFTRMGLSMYYGTPEGQFLITNNSSWPVDIKKRMFQYVPLRNFNGKVCNTSNIIHTSCSFKTVEDNMDDYETIYKFGHIVTNEEHQRSSKC